MTKTKPTLKAQIQRKWHLVDVKDKVLGRKATEIANLLRGKNKAYFVYNLDCGDYVVVVNAKDVQLTGKKETQKTYKRFSGYPSGLSVETAASLRARRPEEVIRRAVAGMLPKNKLKPIFLTRLYISAGSEHQYQDKFKNNAK